MKKLFVLLLTALLLLAACQPTPAEEVVVNKAEGRLEELIVAEPEASPAPERTVRERVGAPETVTEDLSGHVYGGQLTIHIDGPVVVPEVTRVPVYTVRFRAFDPQEKEALTKRLLGTAPITTATATGPFTTIAITWSGCTRPGSKLWTRGATVPARRKTTSSIAPAI